MKKELGAAALARKERKRRGEELIFFPSSQLLYLKGTKGDSGIEHAHRLCNFRMWRDNGRTIWLACGHDPKMVAVNPAVTEKMNSESSGDHCHD